MTGLRVLASHFTVCHMEAVLAGEWLRPAAFTSGLQGKGQRLSSKDFLASSKDMEVRVKNRFLSENKTGLQPCAIQTQGSAGF